MIERRSTARGFARTFFILIFSHQVAIAFSWVIAFRQSSAARTLSSCAAKISPVLSFSARDLALQNGHCERKRNCLYFSL
jgi:hypothetical protein